jgi:hypothetical protein
MALAPPELVAEAILGAVRSGEAEIRVWATGDLGTVVEEVGPGRR